MDKYRYKIADIRDYTDSDFRDMYSGLSQDRQEKADRIKSEKNRKLSILASWLLESLLSDNFGCGYMETLSDNFECSNMEASSDKSGYSYTEAPSGKPYIKEYPNISFSISHSGNYAAAVVSQDENISVGIDIEDFSSIHRKEKNMEDIAVKYFAEEDRAGLTEASPMGFLKIWTMKEAAMKAKEITLFKAFSDVKYDPNDARLKQIVTDEYIASIYLERNSLKK